MVSLLYGLYTREDNGENWRTRFAFLFAMKKDKGKIGFEILSGLFGLDDEYVKVFFIPIKRGSPQKESTAVSSLLFGESCCTQQERY